MNFKPFRKSTSSAKDPSSKPSTVAPEPRPVAAPPERRWSLLIPPGFSRDVH
jgi:hypothetical protein